MALSMKGVFYVGIGMAILALTIWPHPQMRAEKAKRELQETVKRQDEEATRQAKYENERRAERSRQAELIEGATDHSLASLVNECRGSIEKTIRQSSTFSVYFPKYAPHQLEELGNAAIVFRTKMGLPSTLMTDGDPDDRAISQLRKIPGLPIKLVVESASDSFSGIKRWAASFECSVKDLKVETVRPGKLYFMD
ncbi:MAG: hypothetical protein Q8M31_02060 [Beijerinckiaceae bacterium]|nr:hypothetical protein [Beijerinckiaceae bacterium]